MTMEPASTHIVVKVRIDVQANPELARLVGRKLPRHRPVLLLGLIERGRGVLEGSIARLGSGSHEPAAATPVEVKPIQRAPTQTKRAEPMPESIPTPKMPKSPVPTPSDPLETAPGESTLAVLAAKNFDTNLDQLAELL